MTISETNAMERFLERLKEEKNDPKVYTHADLKRRNEERRVAEASVADLTPIRGGRVVSPEQTQAEDDLKEGRVASLAREHLIKPRRRKGSGSRAVDDANRWPDFDEWWETFEKSTMRGIGERHGCFAPTNFIRECCEMAWQVQHNKCDSMRRIMEWMSKLEEEPVPTGLFMHLVDRLIEAEGKVPWWGDGEEPF